MFHNYPSLRNLVVDRIKTRSFPRIQSLFASPHSEGPTREISVFIPKIDLLNFEYWKFSDAGRREHGWILKFPTSNTDRKYRKMVLTSNYMRSPDKFFDRLRDEGVSVIELNYDTTKVVTEPLSPTEAYIYLNTMVGYGNGLEHRVFGMSLPNPTRVKQLEMSNVK